VERETGFEPYGERDEARTVRLGHMRDALSHDGRDVPRSGIVRSSGVSIAVAASDAGRPGVTIGAGLFRGPHAAGSQRERGHVGLAGVFRASGADLWRKGSFWVDLPLEPRQEGRRAGLRGGPALSVEREGPDACPDGPLLRGESRAFHEPYGTLAAPLGSTAGPREKP
jgi:hypothetical protein